MELVEVFIEIAICHSMVDLMTSCHVTDRTSRTEFRLSDQNSKTSSSNKISSRFLKALNALRSNWNRDDCIKF